MVAPANTTLPRFPLGRIVATPGALRACDEAGQEPIAFLQRHVVGDWGELDAEDWQRNDLAVVEGSRILSAYTLSNHTKIWIISESDRSVTTVLLPEDY